MSNPSDPKYFDSTRHPWPCLLFILPLLVGYEACVLGLGGAHPEMLRNGADNWLRMGLEALGVGFSWVPPGILLFVLGLWCYIRRASLPGDLIGTLTGMGIESVSYALGLWGVSLLVAPLLNSAGVEMAVTPAETNAVLQIVPYVGAGIYEEALFRLFLFSSMSWVLRKLEMFPFVGVMLAALGSATLFSTAHHLGPQGQPFSNYLFVFRLVAGLYFVVLYRMRGFGVAVGSRLLQRHG